MSDENQDAWMSSFSKAYEEELKELVKAPESVFPQSPLGAIVSPVPNVQGSITAGQLVWNTPGGSWASSSTPHSSASVSEDESICYSNLGGDQIFTEKLLDTTREIFNRMPDGVPENLKAAFTAIDYCEYDDEDINLVMASLAARVEELEAERDSMKFLLQIESAEAQVK